MKIIERQTKSLLLCDSLINNLIINLWAEVINSSWVFPIPPAVSFASLSQLYFAINIQTFTSLNTTAIYIVPYTLRIPNQYCICVGVSLSGLPILSKELERTQRFTHDWLSCGLFIANNIRVGLAVGLSPNPLLLIAFDAWTDAHLLLYHEPPSCWVCACWAHRTWGTY